MEHLIPNPDKNLIEEIGLEFVRSLAALPAHSQRCALLDFPNHNNVGDNAIWAGERIGLRRAGFRVAYVADLSSYRAKELRERLTPGDVVFLHGGGNLGTVWPVHQRFREGVLRDLREFLVVQLPQSVHFADPNGVNAYTSIVAEHPHAQVWVRDATSAATLSELGPRVRVVPDAAFALGALQRPRTAEVDIFCLLRQDHESRRFPSGFSDVEVGDWLVGEPGRPWMQRAHRATVRIRTEVNRLLAASDRAVRATERWRESAFDHMSHIRIARGLRTLARARVVVTDRLHAHILCVLMGIPHVCLDNFYGKIGRYHEAFTFSSKTTFLASNAHEALSCARSLVRGLG